ncbi:MAG: MmgE/PrpD family protein [Alphaproteobacteria bacterium]
MTGDTVKLAEFAVGLDYDEIPEAVKTRARDSIADTVGTMIFGADLPWSRMIIDYARAMGEGGKSRIMGDGDRPVRAPFAALANGALAHAFEFDGATRPSSGVHPGATMVSSGLALAQERGFGGKDLLTAFIAGAEVMIRIARATKHSNEARGFHAPGTTGPFGAAVVCGKLLGFDVAQMTNALGIAGSLSCGLVEFSRSGTGAMVKRLHFGRAAEGGVLAANLAARGFTGPHTILEGECGLIRVFCDDHDLSQLTRALGSDWLTSYISMKRYACHTTGHTPIEAIKGFKKKEGLTADDVESVTIEVGKKELSRHDIRDPQDIMIGQYSVPFCVALAILGDADDPYTFRDADVGNADVKALMARIKLVPFRGERPTPIATTTIVRTKKGREFKGTVTDFKGTPTSPLAPAELRDKFLMLTQQCDSAKMDEMFARLQSIENETSLEWVSA